MAHQYIFTMINLRKVVPPQREILRGIWLSFLPGAKIGVLGLNGAGKSTLLKIMAGVEKDFIGEAFPGNKVTVGYLPQDPQLDPALNVKENVAQGMKHVTDLIKLYYYNNTATTENMDGDAMEKLLNRQA